MYRATLDRVAQLFSAAPYNGEFNVAREDYFRRTGKVFQDGPMFESRMTAFLEWFLLERWLWDSGIPPIRLYRLKYSETLEEREVAILKSLEESIHSLFRLTSRDRECFSMEDLRTGQKHAVLERLHPLVGAHRGDILDARILQIGDEKFCSDALWIHPSDANSFIEAESKVRRGRDLDGWRSFLFDLAYMRLKRERYAHVPTNQIYDWGMFARDRAEMDRRSADG